MQKELPMKCKCIHSTDTLEHLTVRAPEYLNVKMEHSENNVLKVYKEFLDSQTPPIQEICSLKKLCQRLWTQEEQVWQRALMRCCSKNCLFTCLMKKTLFSFSFTDPRRAAVDLISSPWQIPTPTTEWKIEVSLNWEAEWHQNKDLHIL